MPPSVQKPPNMPWRPAEHVNLLDLILMECTHKKTHFSLESISRKFRSTMPAALQMKRPLKDIEEKALSLLSGDQQDFPQNCYSTRENVIMNYWLKIPLSKQLLNELLKTAVFQLDDAGCIVYYRRDYFGLGEEDTEKPHRMRVPGYNVLLFFLHRMKTSENKVTNEELAEEFMNEYQYIGSKTQIVEKFETLKTTGVQFNVLDCVTIRIKAVAKELISPEFGAWIESIKPNEANQTNGEPISNNALASTSALEPQSRKRNASEGVEGERPKSLEPDNLEPQIESNKNETDSEPNSEELSTTASEPETRKRKASESQEKNNPAHAPPTAEGSDDEIMWIEDSKSTTTDRRSKKSKRADAENDFEIVHTSIVHFGPPKVPQKNRVPAKKRKSKPSISDPVVEMNYDLINELTEFQEVRRQEAKATMNVHIPESPVVLDNAERHMKNLRKNVVDSKREGRLQIKPTALVSVDTVARHDPDLIEIDISENVEEDDHLTGGHNEPTPSAQDFEALSPQIGDSFETTLPIDDPSQDPPETGSTEDIVERHLDHLMEKNSASEDTVSRPGEVEVENLDNETGGENQADSHAEQTRFPEDSESLPTQVEDPSEPSQIQPIIPNLTLVKEEFPSTTVFTNNLIFNLHYYLTKLDYPFLEDLTKKAEVARDQPEADEKIVSAEKIESCLIEVVQTLKDGLSVVMGWNGSMDLQTIFTFLSVFVRVMPNFSEDSDLWRKLGEVWDKYAHSHYRVPADTARQAIRILFKLCEIKEDDFQI